MKSPAGLSKCSSAEKVQLSLLPHAVSKQVTRTLLLAVLMSELRRLTQTNRTVWKYQSIHSGSTVKINMLHQVYQSYRSKLEQ